MTNQIRPEAGSIPQAAVLTLIPDADQSPDGLCASEIEERFLCAAAQVPEGAFLGWQLSFDGSPAPSGFLFTSSRQGVTEDDCRWIFDAWANTSGFVPLSDLYQGNRRVYLLATFPEPESSSPPVYARRGITYEEHCRFFRISNKSFTECCSILMELGAVVRMLASPAQDGRNVRGMILASLPGEMPLRLRASFAYTFPDVKPVELQEWTKADGWSDQMSDIRFESFLSMFLWALLPECPQSIEDKYQISDEELDALYDCDEDGERLEEGDVERGNATAGVF